MLEIILISKIQRIEKSKGHIKAFCTFNGRYRNNKVKIIDLLINDDLNLETGVEYIITGNYLHLSNETLFLKLTKFKKLGEVNGN